MHGDITFDLDITDQGVSALEIDTRPIDDGPDFGGEQPGNSRVHRFLDVASTIADEHMRFIAGRFFGLLLPYVDLIADSGLDSAERN